MPRSKDAIQSLPLANLVKSDANRRKTPPGVAAQAELKASIAAHGLQQNLVVRPSRKKGVHEVIAGGRRLDALKALQAEGALPADHAVPCQVRTKNLEEISLAENTVRAPMHPADEFEAFAGLADKGRSAAAIARRFGTTERHVRQRLKLGKVAPELLRAYRDGEMDLEMLTAFTLSDDHEAQRAVWTQVRASYHPSAHGVRRLLTETAVAITSRLGRFVGVEVYEAAGGHVLRDLFSDRDDGYLEDAGLVRKLALEKLETRAKALEAEWSWAKAMLDPDYGFAAEFGRVHPRPIGLPEAVAREIERIDARLDEVEELDETAWTEAVQAEVEKLADRRQELDAVLRAHMDFTAEDRARAGCVVTIGPDGEEQVHAGLVPREALEAEARNGHAEDFDPAPRAGRSDMAAAALSPEQSLRKETGVSQVLIEDLKAHRLQITKAHLAADFDTAFDLALYSLCLGAHHGGYRANPLDLRATPTHQRSSLNDLDGTPADRRLTARRETLPCAWLTLPPAEGFAALCALPAGKKQALFAWCVAQCLEAQLSFEDRADPVIERAGQRLGIDFAAHWRPRADNYWSRVKKDHTLETGGRVLGQRWQRDHARLKKPQIAKALEAAFSGEGSTGSAVDADALAEAAKWLPAGMAYGAEAGEDGPHAAHAAFNGADADGVVADGSEADESDAVVLPEFLTDGGASVEAEAASQG